jgi:sec-independent protein translocase protein TatA
MFENLLQPSHLLIVLVICLFIFGPKKLPELGQGLGKGIRSFRDSMRQATSDEAEKPAATNNTAETTTPRQ